MKTNIFKKIITITVLIALSVTCVVGCDDAAGTPSATIAPSASPSPESTDKVSTDAPQNTAFVAKIGDISLYESQFYYFLYTALSETFYGSEEYSKLGTEAYADKTDDEKKAIFTAFFYKKAEGSEKTNLQIAAERALEICHTFNITASLGKANNLVTQETIDKALSDVDTVADRYASYYKKSRDESMKSMYGMNVNDMKDYTTLQCYGNAYMEKWKKDNGYVFSEKEPTKPTKPTAPGKDATADEQKKYDEQMKKYDEDLADYNDALKAYKEKESAFWEQFREAYNKGADAYKIISVRYLFISTTDSDGKKLDDAAKKAKKEEIESYVNLSTVHGYDFSKVVKGFSESEENLCDIDIANGSDTPFSADIVLWASKADKITNEIKIFETSKGYYAVQVCGITDFDKTVGSVKDAQKVASPEKVRDTVSYFHVSDLYNQYVLMLAEDTAYALSDINYDRMYELAEDYMFDTESDDSSEDETE